MEETLHNSEQRLMVIHATLSPTEEHCERYRRTVGLFLGPVVAGLSATLCPTAVAETAQAGLRPAVAARGRVAVAAVFSP